MRKFSIILALLAGAMMPLTAVAQDSSKSSSSKKKSKKKGGSSHEEQQAPAVADDHADGFDMSNEQVMLNDQAAEAQQKGDYAKAEQLFLAMQAIQELDIIYMNLGRTYSKEGKCLEAADAYSHVSSAPHYSGFDRDMIRDTTAKFKADLDKQCSAKIVMSCNPADMTVQIDGGREMPCSTKPLTLTPGRHSFYGKTSYGFNTVVVEGVANQTVEAKIEVIDYETIAVEAGVSPEVIRKKSTLFKALGYSFLGVGVATAGVGGYLMGNYYFKYNDMANDDPQKRKHQNEYQTYIHIGTALVAGGSAIAVTGIILLIVDAVKIQPQLKMLESKTSYFHIDPILSPEFNGMTMTFDF